MLSLLPPAALRNAALSCLLPLAALGAQDDPAATDYDRAVPEGHSHLGESFNEGPRQAAYKMPGMNPDVSFPVSTTVTDAQAFFDQGIVQLHGFWYLEAERSFRQVAALDPECAMAYFGMALANVENEERAHGFAREAWERRDAVSDRERRYIEAVARLYGADQEKKDGEAKDWEPPASRSDADKRRRRRFVEDLEELIHHHPDDVEAYALLANQLWLNTRAGIPIESRLANQGLLDHVFAAQPMHPAHHYRVHLWDTKKTAERVTDSAAKIGHAAPGIAHMWHMSGHIWAKLDRHDDAAWQQEASARVDHAYMMRDRVMPDQIHNYAHNNEWLCRSLRHVGRVDESIDLARNMVELPRHPVWNDPEGGYNSANYGVRRLLETLETWEAWDQTLALADTMYLDQGDDLRWSSKRLRLLARARFARQERAALAELATAADAMLEKARHLRAEAIDAAECEALDAGKPSKDVETAVTNAARDETRTVREVRDIGREIRALASWMDGDRDEALATLEDVDHDATHLSRLWLEHGDADKALEIAKKAARSPGIAAPIANLVHVAFAAGKTELAEEKFEELRAMSARFDLRYPPFQRLAEIAAEFGHGSDWRVAYELPKDVGERPDLDTLGPFRWSPVAAPDWSLPNAAGETIRLADLRGQPTLLVFFLGFGCVHCVEQLQALHPMVERFHAAGIRVVAIGTDTVDEVAASEAAADPVDRYPFPILSDPERRVFADYRCIDDFEKIDLHGTFLLDADGLVRWQDIGYEPYMELDFLLKEAQRLLALPVTSG